MTTSQLEPYYRDLYNEQVKKIVEKIVETRKRLVEWKKDEAQWTGHEQWNYEDVEEFTVFLEDLVGISFSDGRVHPRSGEIPRGVGRA